MYQFDTYCNLLACVRQYIMYNYLQVLDVMQKFCYVLLWFTHKRNAIMEIRTTTSGLVVKNLDASNATTNDAIENTKEKRDTLAEDIVTLSNGGGNEPPKVALYSNGGGNEPPK